MDGSKFTIGNGLRQDNPWKMPEGYSQQFLLLLQIFNFRIITTAESWVIVEPSEYRHPNYGKWFLISDNGGELIVKEINSEKLSAKIPYSTIRKGVLNPSTVAHRVELIIRGISIDWNTTISDEDHTFLIKSFRLVP